MRKKYFGMIMGIATACLCMAGCGDRKEPDITEGEVFVISDEDKLAASILGEDSAATNMTKSKKAVKEASDTDSSGTEPEGEGNEPKPSELGAFYDAFKNGEVEHNGSYFVRVGDKVYYRVFNEESIERPTIGGYIAEKDEAVQSKIMSYDLKSGETEFVTTTYGKGEMFIDAEGFVFSEPLKPGSVLSTVDGPDKRPYLEGSPVAVSQDGLGIVTRDYIENGEATISVIHAYYNGEEIATIEDGEGYYTTILGYAGNNLFVMKSCHGDKKYFISSYNEHGSCTDYGKLKLAAGNFLYDPVPEFEQLVCSDREAYIMFGYYEGSGHYYSGYELYKVDIGVSSSLLFLEVGDASGAYTDYAPKIYLDGKDKPVKTHHLKGEIGFAGSGSGDLVYYSKPDSPTVIMKSFVARTPANGDEIQSVDDWVAFGDDAFILLNDATRDKSGDIGWRSAYSITETNFIHIPFGKDDLNENGEAMEEDKLETLSFDE